MQYKQVLMAELNTTCTNAVKRCMQQIQSVNMCVTLQGSKQGSN